MLFRYVFFATCHLSLALVVNYTGRVFRKINRIEQVIPKGKSRGTIIFLHGIGDTGPGFKRWFNVLLGNNITLFKDMHLIFPTSPLAPHGEKRHLLVNTWYEERYYKYRRGREDLAFTYPIFQDFMDIISNETNPDIPESKIFIGGFGMGGNMAMQFTYKYNLELGGVFSLSGFLKRHSITFRMIKSSRKINKYCRLPDIFMVMGEEDPEVDPENVVKTFKRLRRLGVQGKLNTMLHGHHQITKNELIFLNNWIEQQLIKEDF